MSPSSTSSSDRRTAAALAFRAAVFVCGFALLSAAVAPLHRELLYRTDRPHVLERMLTSELPDAPQVLLMGDSHVGSAADPRAFPDAFCYATNGESYVQTAAKLRHYLSAGGRPGVVVLPADPHSFAGFRAARILDYRYWSMHVDMLALARRTGDVELVEEWLRGRALHWTGRGDDLWRDVYGGARRGWKPPALGGFVPREPRLAEMSTGERAALAEKASARHYEPGDFENDIMVDAFRDALRACADAGVPVVLVRYPLHESYAAIVPAGARAAADRQIAWAMEQSLVAGVVDRSAWRATDVAAFYDTDHLAAEAAAAFSSELWTELEPVLDASQSR